MFIKEEQTNRSKGNELSYQHLEDLLLDFQWREEFVRKLALGKIFFLKRLESFRPLMRQKFVENVAYALKFIHESSHKTEWTADIERNMDSFVLQQVLRLFALDQLDHSTISLLKSCPPIAENEMFRTIILGKVKVQQQEQTSAGASEPRPSSKCLAGGMPKRSKGAIKSSKRIDGTIDAVYVHKVKDPPTIVQPAHLVWMLGEYHDSNEFVKCLQISKEPFFLRMATKMRT